MGNTNQKDELTDENLLSSELAVLELSGLPRDHIKQENIEVGEFEGKKVYLRTVLCGHG